MKHTTNQPVKRMAVIAMLGALSGVLMLFEFRIPFMPPFYKLDIGDLPALLGGFLLGPYAAVSITVIKLLVKLVQLGTDSLLVGELSNLVCSLSFTVPAAWIYKKNKNRKGAIMAMFVGSITMTAIGMISNAYVMLPLYASVYGLSMDKIVEMCHLVNPAVNSVAGLLMLGTLPFNALKGLVVSILTFLVYKKSSTVLRRIME